MRRSILPKSAVFATTLFAVVCINAPAQAMMARDVLEKMTADQRSGYFTGLVDMLSYQHLLDGNEQRAECVVAWFYDRDGTIKKVLAAFERFPDKAAEGIFILMARKACGPSKAASETTQK